MKKIEKFIVRDIAGDHVMMPIGGTASKFNGLIMANDVAAFIWNHIEKVDSAEEMADLICEEFEVEHEVALNDTVALLAEMKKAGWIE